MDYLSYFGGLVRGCPPVISPTFDDFEVIKYFREPLRPATDEFRILFNANKFNPKEIEILSRKGIVEIRAKHELKQNGDGIWMKRECVYTYNLPHGIQQNLLSAQWSEDNYILIQATSSKVECSDDAEQISLVPIRVSNLLNPNVEMKVLKNLFSNISDKSSYALRYMRFCTLNAPCPVEKKISETASKLQSSNEQSSEVSPMDQEDEGCRGSGKDPKQLLNVPSDISPADKRKGGATLEKDKDKSV